MSNTNFSTLFMDLRLPVLVCKNTKSLPFVYMNTQAMLMFTPTYSVDKLSSSSNVGLGLLADVVQFESTDDFESFILQLKSNGYIDNYSANIITFDNKLAAALISGNYLSINKTDDFIVLYFSLQASKHDTLLRSNSPSNNNGLSDIVNEAFIADSVDASIQQVITMAGLQTNVSRVYVFEDISPSATSNTYEWCASEVEPAIQDLTVLEKKDYNYDVISSSRMYIANDVHDLPENDRDILEAQGIKSLAIIPFFDQERMLGYVGFDDTLKTRNWSYNELQFLQSISGLLRSLIKRRNAETAMQRTLNVLQIVSDSSEDVIYANNLEDYTLMFVSLSLAKSIGQTPEKLMGRKCWEVLQHGQTGPCDFCPIPKIQITPGAERSSVYVWENQNSLTKKTYLVRDSILKWVDGKYAHVETATDISQRKKYEIQLKHYASTDIMTGTLNREWGAKKLSSALKSPNSVSSLCFIDVDGLKTTNDSFGHDAGDDLLIEMASTIRKHMNEDEIICRWGGDEFLLLLYCDTKTATKRIYKMQDALKKHNETNNNPYKIAFSFGVVAFEKTSNTSIDPLITVADELMYRNKLSARGQLMHRRHDD